VIATLCILLRTYHQFPELKTDFPDDLKEYMPIHSIIQNALVLMAVACLTAFHPGVALGNQWEEPNRGFEARKGDNEGRENRMSRM
jgi:hypothetical protein